MNRILSYLNQPIINIGWFTGIDITLPRWLTISLSIIISVSIFLGIKDFFENFGVKFIIHM